jgi:single-strand DNA-binding protein
MLNKIIVMGRLTKDPELRYTNNNTPVAGFSLAVDRNYVKDSGERETDFFDIIAWQNRAEFVSKYFTKGQLVCVEGRLQQRKWTDAEGKTRYAYEVVAESVHFAGHKKNDDQNHGDMGADFDPFAGEAA